MMVNFTDAVILSDSGALSAKHERIAEIIQDLDPTLELVWIPPEARSSFDRHPFGVRHSPRDGRPPYIAMTMAEDEVDERIIAKLIKRDTHRGSVIDELEAHDNALRLMEYKKHMDELDEKRDFAHSVLRSPKNWYRHAGKVYRG